MCTPTSLCVSTLVARLEALAVMPLAASASPSLPPATLPPGSFHGGLCLLVPGACPQPRHHQQLLDQPIARLDRLGLPPLDQPIARLDRLRLLPIARELLPLARRRSLRLLSVCLGRPTLNCGKLISWALRDCWRTLALFLTMTGWLRWMAAIRVS